MSHVVALELVIMHVEEFGLRHFDPVPAAHDAAGVLVPISITRPNPTGGLGL
jgi:hypothetical protein